MSLPSKDKTPPSDYKDAENMINKALANMDHEGHIEYGAPINSNNSSCQQWWRSFLRKIIKRKNDSNIVSRQKD